MPNISPSTQVDVQHTFAPTTIKSLLELKPDVLVDAISQTNVSLLIRAGDGDVVTVGGAGGLRTNQSSGRRP